MLSSESLRHRSCVIGFVESWIVEPDREGSNRLRALLLHERDNG